VPGSLDDGAGHDTVGDVEDGIAVFRPDAVGNEQVVGVREGRGILAEVERMRPSVAAQELNMAGHPAVELNRKGIVVGGDATEDFGHGTEVGVWPGGRGRRNGGAGRSLGYGRSRRK